MTKNNSALTTDDVKHVAKLAHLSLTDSEVSKFQKQLAPVVSYIHELSEVHTEGIEPTSQTTGLENIMDEDKIKKENILSVEDALSGTQNAHNDYFAVPMILIEKDLGEE